MFLRRTPFEEIQGPDDSHVIFARVLDSEDSRGFWIELNTGEHEKNSAVERHGLMIPWGMVLATVLAKGFSPALRNEARKIGFATRPCSASVASTDPKGKQLES